VLDGALGMQPVAVGRRFFADGAVCTGTILFDSRSLGVCLRFHARKGFTPSLRKHADV